MPKHRWNIRIGLMTTSLLLCLFALPGSAAPVDTSNNPDLASQRFHYQKAKAALALHNDSEFETHMTQLGDYPLKQYLEFAQIRNNFKSLPFAQLDDFFTKYPDSFLETRLRANLLHFLASRQRWKDYLNYYSVKMGSLILQCHYLHARIKTGDTQALEEVGQLWDVGKSQPSECDPLFKTWQAAGQLSQELVWSRFHHAMENNNLSFARFLSRSLTDAKPLADLYLQVYQNPKLITERNKFEKHDLATQQIISHGIKRLAVKDPLEALYHWEMYESQQLFPTELIRDTKLNIVKRLIRGGHAKAAQTLLNFSHALRHQDLVEEIAREALAELDWQRLAEALTLLDNENQNSERWQYWAARIQEELKTPLPGYESPAKIYQQLAQNRSFYGFLASDKLEQGYSLVDFSQPLEATVLAAVGQLGAMQRAYELWLTGNSTEAKAEWLHLSRSLSDDQLLAAGQLARDWGWYNTGIQAMISGNYWNQLTVRFPLAYQDEIYRIAQDTQVEPTLIYAIARQESAFDELALSPVGAMGLMQLMPQTALFTAKKSGIEHSRKNQLLDAEHNMRLGGFYLNHLLQRFDGNRILAAAAYNAGPHRVSRWLSEQGKERPVDVWIETIPYKETRHYVQNILCFSVIYGYRLGQPTAFLSAEEAKRFL